MISIRAAKIEDLEILLDFEQAIVAFERPFDAMLKETHIHYYDLGQLITSEQSEVLVAVSNDEIVGSGYAKIVSGQPYEKNHQQGYIGFLYVKPNFRRMGINKRILAKLIEWTKSIGMKEVRLHVYDENQSAVAAYKKAGFATSLLEMRQSLEE